MSKEIRCSRCHKHPITFHYKRETKRGDTDILLCDYCVRIVLAQVLRYNTNLIAKITAYLRTGDSSVF